MVAALAWGPLAGAIAGLTATLALDLALGAAVAIGYALSIALPAWWLAHLVLLGRPLSGASATVPGEPLQVEWYPPGRVLLWTAILGAVVSMASLLSLDTDASAINEVLRRNFTRTLQAMSGSAISESDPRIGLLVSITPVLLAATSVMTICANLWLAAKVAAISGALRRRWPDLARIALPPLSLAILCVALAFCFGAGMLAMAAKVVAGALLTAYALSGFAVLHTITVGLNNRALWLGAIYAAVLLFSFGLLLVMALGVADALLGLRERFWRSRPPLPASGSNP